MYIFYVYWNTFESEFKSDQSTIIFIFPASNCTHIIYFTRRQGSQRPLDFLQDIFDIFTGPYPKFYRIYRTKLARINLKK